MSTKITKKVSVKKSENWKSKTSVTTETWNHKISSNVEKKSTTKKNVVKRRKLDLTPTRASAVAIVSQANRAKKQELIDKISSADYIVGKKEKISKIPSWVWIFFWCSLLLFCISFYQAIIRPQLEDELTNANINNVDNIDRESSHLEDWDSEIVSLWWSGDSNQSGLEEIISDWIVDQQEIFIPKTAIETIEEYFKRLSNHQFDEAFNLFTPTLQRSSEIREHFTSFRMNPFISWIKDDLVPTNIKYISTSTYWRDKYGFDLSYTLENNNETYEETWEFVIDTTWDDPKIATVLCTTSKCSRHPIFWPESFGMMR